MPLFFDLLMLVEDLSAHGMPFGREAYKVCTLFTGTVTSQSLCVLTDKITVSVYLSHGAEAKVKWRAALTHSELFQSVMVVLPESRAGAHRIRCPSAVLASCLKLKLR